MINGNTVVFISLGYLYISFFFFPILNIFFFLKILTFSWINHTISYPHAQYYKVSYWDPLLFFSLCSIFTASSPFLGSREGERVRAVRKAKTWTSNLAVDSLDSSRSKLFLVPSRLSRKGLAAVYSIF